MAGEPAVGSNSLSDITTGLSNLVIETSTLSDSEPQTQHARLVLLQPLAQADNLAACRNQRSRFPRNGDGSIVRPSNFEYLNIQPLGAAWRQAVKNAAPFPHVTFDLTLPKEEESSSAFQKVYWDISMPQEGGIAVYTQDAMTMVITLATGIRMREKGDLRFDVAYGESDGVGVHVMKSLEKQLLNIQKFKAPVRGE